MEATPETIHILIVDDHYVARFGLRRLIESQKDMKVVGEAKDGIEAVAKFRETRPDLVMMDLRMDRFDGIRATAMLCAEDPDAKILVVSSYDTEEELQQVCEAGAGGFIMKEAEPEELLTAIRSVANGMAYLPLRVWRNVSGAKKREPLSAREIELLRLVAKGHKNRDIAEMTELSPGTVKVYVCRILGKLGASNRAEAIKIAVNKGLLQEVKVR